MLEMAESLLKSTVQYLYCVVVRRANNNVHAWNAILKATRTISVEVVSSPELLNEVLALLDDVDGGLQGGLLLLAKTLDQILNRFHRLCVHIVQQFLLELLQPSPELTVAQIRKRGIFISHLMLFLNLLWVFIC